MARLGETFGWGSNPIYQGLSDNRNAIMQFGAGLAGGSDFGDGLARGAIGLNNGSQADDAAALLEAEKAQQQQALNQTTEWLKNNGKDALYQAVSSGAMSPSDAWGIALQEDAAARQAPEMTANMRDYQFAQANPGYAQFINPGSAAEPTSAIREYEYAKGQGFGGSFQEYQQTSRPAPAMNATTQKAILESDDAVQAGQGVISGLDRALELNNVAYDGPFADQRSAASALFGDQGGIATQELKNVVTAQALESLKAVFGGMPTEGERKILLEIQGSVDQPKAVRENIYRRAKAAAERRIAINQQEGASMRSGDYFTPGYSPNVGRPAGNTTSSGLSWSIEP